MFFLRSSAVLPSRIAPRLLFLGLFITASCGKDLAAGDLDWRVAFACESDRNQADQVTLQLRKGGCTGKAVYSASIARGESAPQADSVDPGRWGFEAVASLQGVEVARGCVVASLPARAPVVTQLTSARCTMSPDSDAGGGDGDGDGEGDGDAGSPDAAAPDGSTADGGMEVTDCSKGCDDGNACTSDQCLENKCVSFPFSATLECDQVLCTIGDVCEKGRCVSGAANDSFCKDEEVCTKEICLAGQGCTSMNVAGPCDDPTSCITGESCAYGRCWGKSTCNGGQICDRALDGCVSCTNDEQCDDNDPCTVDDCSCDTDDCSAGLCTHQPAGEGSSCSDGFECTVEDVCQQGVCVGKPQDGSCNDSVDCTVDKCELGKGCTFTASSDVQTVCTDSQECTTGDHCKQGKCVGTESCPGDQFCSPTGRCVECVNTADCDNSNPCIAEVCTEGVCVPGFKNGATCQDPYACTTGDFCSDGVCKTGPGRNHPACNDQIDCTEDLCNPPGKNGCTNQVKDGLTCNDGVGCTGPDLCSQGKCIGADLCAGDPVCDLTLKICVTCTKPTDCDDKKPCTDDKCTNGVCQNLPLTTGPGGCDDGTTCSKNDRCNNGVCIADADHDFCNDTSVPHPECTTDTCVPGSGGRGCVSVYNQNACVDQLSCTDVSVCNQGSCQGTHTTCGDNAICGDDNACHCTIAGEQSCGSICVNTNTSPTNCGGCGQKCRAGETCEAGYCMPPGASGNCTGYRYGGHDYLSCKDTSCSNAKCPWDSARSKCKSFPGWDLVVINDLNENATVKSIVGGSIAWIGANDKGDNGDGVLLGTNGCGKNHPHQGEGSWYWIAPGGAEEGSMFCEQGSPDGTCTSQSSRYTNFGSKQPDNANCSCPLFGSCSDGEDCATIYQSDGTWNDDDCGASRRYICESYVAP